MPDSHRGRRKGAAACEAPPPPAAAPRSHDEERRLRALNRYRVVDTPPEPAFNCIANLARALFGTPAGLVSLVDETRQWFKARPGFEQAETPRDWAFCAYTILSDEPLVVPDARQDPRFADNLLVTGGPRIRFYAGAPIVTPDGLRLGSVCVASPEPRDEALGREDLARLTDLAALAMDHLELRLRTRALAEAVQERDAALARAREPLAGAASPMGGGDRRATGGLRLVHASPPSGRARTPPRAWAPPSVDVKAGALFDTREAQPAQRQRTGGAALARVAPWFQTRAALSRSAEFGIGWVHADDRPPPHSTGAK